MIKQFNTFLLNKKIYMIIIIIFILFMVVVLPLVNLLSQQWIGVSESPDTMMFYHSSDFYALLTLYGLKGRQIYIVLRWTFDLVYPFVYGLFLYASLLKFNQKIKFLLLPIFGVVFDFLENITATINVAVFPKEFNFLVYIMQGFSFLKWFFIILSFILLLYFLVKFMIEKSRK